MLWLSVNVMSVELYVVYMLDCLEACLLSKELMIVTIAVRVCCLLFGSRLSCKYLPYVWMVKYPMKSNLGPI